MKNKFKFLTITSLKRKLKTKWFLFANILIALIIIGVCNVDNIIKLFGGDFDNLTKIYVVDNTNTYDIFSTTFNQLVVSSSLDLDKYELINSDLTKDELIEEIKNDSKSDSIILVINFDEQNILSVDAISNSYIDTVDSNIISSSLNNVKLLLSMDKYNISEEEFLALTSNVSLNIQVLDEANDIDSNMTAIMTTVFPMFILPIFMLTIFLVQMIGAEVNDEKTTKGMEIIISNVSPKVHFFSKCLAGNLFVLIQGFFLITYSVIGLLSRNLFGSDQSIISNLSSMFGGIFTTSFISSLKYLIPLMLVLIVLTFISYSLLAGILASMTTNTEDFQQIQTPIMMILLIGYYLAIMAGTFKGSLFIKVLGYVPFISSILSPSLLIIGDFTIFDVLISIVLIIITIFLLVRYGLRIYKVGILNYSSNGLFKKMFKAIKNK